MIRMKIQHRSFSGEGIVIIKWKKKLQHITLLLIISFSQSFSLKSLLRTHTHMDTCAPEHKDAVLSFPQSRDIPVLHMKNLGAPMTELPHKLLYI